MEVVWLKIRLERKRSFILNINKFLRVFGIHSLDELPETEALSVAAAQADGEQLSITEEGASAESETAPKDYEAPVDTEETDVIFEHGAEPTTADEPQEASPEEEHA